MQTATNSMFKKIYYLSFKLQRAIHVPSEFFLPYNTIKNKLNAVQNVIFCLCLTAWSGQPAQIGAHCQSYVTKITSFCSQPLDVSGELLTLSVCKTKLMSYEFRKAFGQSLECVLGELVIKTGSGHLKLDEVHLVIHLVHLLDQNTELLMFGSGPTQPKNVSLMPSTLLFRFQ